MPRIGQLRPLKPDDRRIAPATPEPREPSGRASGANATPAPPPLPAVLAYRTLDLFALGVVLVDSSLGCVFANRAARAILRRGPVSIGGSRIVCTPQKLCGALVDAVRRVLSNTTAGPHAAAEVVSYPAEPEPLRIVVSSLATPGLAVAALFVAPPAQGRQSDAELLRRLFALTRVEAEVAELLCRGHTPEEIARLMRLSLHTIRAHLRAVFTKTGARRQADLVRVVLRGAGALQL